MVLRAGRMSAAAVTAIAVAVVIALIAVGAIFLGGGEDTYHVSAYFPRAIGLFERSTVRVLGVEVGRISSVTPDGDRVRVDMNIRDGVKIPEDASAVIVPISLISDRYVQFVPVWKGGPTLHDGSQVPLSRGVAPAELDDLLATLKRFLQAVEPGTTNEPGALGRLIQNADNALAGRGPQMAETIDTLSTVLDALGRNVGSVDQAIVNLDRLFNELSKHAGALTATNRGLATVMTSLADEEAALQSGTGDLADLVDQVGSLVKAHKSDLSSDLSVLADVAEILHRQKIRLLENLLWLPVLSKGAANAYDPVNKRVRVRDPVPLILP
jgi:phospholipid/cholesterol/gamma-HCH transport system substrate-binding protein